MQSTRRVEGGAQLTTGGTKVPQLEFGREVLAQTLGTALGAGLIVESGFSSVCSTVPG
jgi:hypothetical protein